MLLLLIAVAVIAPAGEESSSWLHDQCLGRSIGRNSAILRASLFFAFIHILNTVGASTTRAFLACASSTSVPECPWPSR